MEALKVLSLFDGISSGQVALERAEIPVEIYYASEIDKYAIQVTQKNYPNTIQLGDITKINFADKKFKDIDLIIGGSPCQDLAICGKREGLKGKRSGLFYKYVEALNTIKPKYFLLENNVGMPKEAYEEISKQLGCYPIEINSSLVSAQNRRRYYWTNIKNITVPKDKNIFLKDILLDIECEKIENFKNCVRKNVIEQYDEIVNSKKTIHQLKCESGFQDNKVGILKSPTLRASNAFTLALCKNNTIRRLLPIEWERLQTLPDNYTKFGMSCYCDIIPISSTQRYKCIGNGWTVDVIAHILKGLTND